MQVQASDREKHEVLGVIFEFHGAVKAAMCYVDAIFVIS